MGIWDKWKKVRNNKKELSNQEEATNLDLEQSTVEVDVPEERNQFLRENCDRIIEAIRQVEEAKIEYQAVSSYLTDTQKMDGIPEDERKKVEEDARQIITLTRQREQYQKGSKAKITEKQLNMISRYEDEMIPQIRRISENEAYQNLIKSDMHHLEGEKGALRYEYEGILRQGEFLKKIAILVCSVIFLMFIGFYGISVWFYRDMTIPFLLTILLGALGGFYIFMEIRRNRHDTMLCEKKRNRAVLLMNKVKIKYVNNSNALDYAYKKYGVNNSLELNYLWEQYGMVRAEERKYKKNSDELSYYNDDLTKELRKHQIADPDIWVYQAAAILDQKEMVEIRHRLNVRRQNLRERIEYNEKIKETGSEQIKELLQKNPELKEEVIQILSEYHIRI